MVQFLFDFGVFGSHFGFPERRKSKNSGSVDVSLSGGPSGSFWVHFGLHLGLIGRYFRVILKLFSLFVRRCSVMFSICLKGALML